jgi:uncharacterized RDD family membrane protein YckC
VARTLGAPPADKFERAFVTSEGIDLRLRLGSFGERVIAFIIDLGLMLAALIVLLIVGAFFFAGTGGGAQESVTIFWLLVLFVLRNGYFIAFELGMRAATPGKRIMKLRVVARDGGRLTGEAVVARNAMRELEFFVPLSFLTYQGAEGLADFGEWLAGVITISAFLLFPLLNRDRLRVGDLIAGTWVVRLPRRELGRSVAERSGEPLFVFTDAQLSAYGEFELQKLEEVLRREDELSMIVVARTIRTRIGWIGEGNDHAFLQAYYTALCQRLERGMLFGKRRADKYQKG